MIYLQLFLSFLQIGAFSFGGGYAAMPLIQSQVVDHHGWLTMQEFTDLITISQMTPGPIAVNSATFVGIQIAGPLGALVATLGCILPSCIFVTALAYIYMKYRKMSLLQGILGSLRPAVVSLIAIARRNDPDFSSLHKRRRGIPDRQRFYPCNHMVYHCSNPAAQKENGSHPGYGFVRRF